MTGPTRDIREEVRRQTAEVERLRADLARAEQRHDELLRQANAAGGSSAGTPDRASTAGSVPDPQAADLAGCLSRELPFLEQSGLSDAPQTVQRTAEVLSTLVQAFKRVEQTIGSQLEVLGKSNPQIKSLAENLAAQGLLDVERAIAAVMRPTARLTRLHNYTELLLRWWSAILTGVQTTVPQIPHELAEALNPASWQLEKKRWSSEAEACWNHFRYVVRQELPLKMGDQMKQLQAHKTLEAYAILGGGARSAPEP